jgi:hypothetical protein
MDDGLFSYIAELRKKPLPSCLLHVLVTSKAVIGAVFSFFFEICEGT